MKRYFTKLIPVDRHAGKGDIILSKTGQPLIWGDQPRHGISAFTWSEVIQYLKEFTCADLMVISTDIKVGDDITLDGVEFIKYEAGEVDSIWQEHVNKGFKIIGKVSPAAIWVKPGDAFNEDDFAFFWEQDDMAGYSKIKEGTGEDFYIFDTEHLGYTDEKRRAEGWERTPAEFKCPTCRTFH